MPQPRPTCPLCDGPLVTISLRFSGKEMVMRSCSTCDTRFWQASGEDVELPDVLGRDPARQPALR